MLQKVEIDDAGETVDPASRSTRSSSTRSTRAAEEGKKPATGHPVLLGITKARCRPLSFISAASFQETTRVSHRGCRQRVDTLEGPKENVIVGRLIRPAPAPSDERAVEVAGGGARRAHFEEREREAVAKAAAEQAAAAAAAAAPAPEPAQLPAAE